MGVPCPGTEKYSHIFGVGRNGATPMAAFIRAFLVLIFDIASSAALKAFLAKDCDAPCSKSLTGPSFTNHYVRITPRRRGGWTCVMGVTVKAQIDCTPITAAVEPSDAEVLEGLLAQLHQEEQQKGAQKGAAKRRGKKA